MKNDHSEFVVTIQKGYALCGMNRTLYSTADDSHALLSLVTKSIEKLLTIIS